MNYKQEIINKFEELVHTEILNLEKLPDEHERFLRLDVLYKIHKYLVNFDDLEPVLNKYFEEKKKKDKWKER